MLDDVKLTNRHHLMKISAKNTYGLKNLFTEIDSEYSSDFLKYNGDTVSPT